MYPYEAKKIVNTFII